jgi:hypothetical protein
MTTSLFVVIAHASGDADFISQLRDTLSGKHLVMFGDGVMRNQYLSLVYALRYRHLVSDDMKLSIMDDLEWGGYRKYNEPYIATNNLLLPFEFCDCHRVFGNPARSFEIRYYHEPESEIAVTFYFWRGQNMRGHWDVGDPDILRFPSARYSPEKWETRYEGIVEKVKNYEASFPWKPSSSIVLMNLGFWDMGCDYVNNPQKLRDIINASQTAFDKFIWKTTSHYIPGFEADPKFGGTREHHDRRDKYMCSQAEIQCMDINWTKELSKEDYRDHMLVKPHSFNRMNFQLLDMLRNA